MDKDEITKMPEGMSSEELDALTTGEEVEEPENLAQEALDATKEDSPPAEESVKEEPEVEEPEKEEPAEEKSEVDPKDAVIGDFRRKNRDLEIERARLQGELEARKSIQTEAKEPPKSPMDIAEADYFEQNGSMQGFSISPDLYRQQRTFETEQATAKVSTEKQEQASSTLEQVGLSLQEGELSSEKMGEGLDLQSVVNMGEKNLTRGDLVDLKDLQAQRGTEVTVKKYYKMLIQRTLEAGGNDAKLLQSAISKSQTKPKKEKTDIDALTTEDEDTNKGEAETDTQSENAKLAYFVCNP